jgi:hypothetical protein
VFGNIQWTAALELISEKLGAKNTYHVEAVATIEGGFGP